MLRGSRHNVTGKRAQCPSAWADLPESRRTGVDNPQLGRGRAYTAARVSGASGGIQQTGGGRRMYRSALMYVALLVGIQTLAEAAIADVGEVLILRYGTATTHRIAVSGDGSTVAHYNGQGSFRWTPDTGFDPLPCELTLPIA